MTWPECPYRLDNVCNIASLLAGHDIETTLTDCIACKKHDIETNPITTGLAGLQPPPGEGPGTGLTRVFSWFVAKPEGCDCPNRAAMMDVWGGPGCLDRFPLIMSWLRESALDNNYIYNEWIVTSLLRSFLKSYE